MIILQNNTIRIANFLAVLSMVVLMGSVAQAQKIVLPQTGSDPVVLSVAGQSSLDELSSGLLQVFTGQADQCCEGRTAIAGRYTVSEGSVAFAPTFGFDPGQNYIALVQTHDGEERVAFSIGTQAEAVPAVVTAVFPSGDVIPENTLRFYIHFSVPMAPNRAADFIKLRDASGLPDEAAFMRFKQELWNEDRTRLTLLMDPGRIKRNVATNLELGPALLKGQRYALTVDDGWLAADGRSTLPAFSKPFNVGAPLRQLPDVDYWKATAPCVGTRGSLNIVFDRPFDRHLLTQLVRVNDADDNLISGDITPGRSEKSLTFVPDRPWPEGGIQVVVSPTLEDVAGNNFRDLLDHLAESENVTQPATVMSVDVASCSH